jgi:thiol-disulfide isomerase/thioredoxin
VITLAASSSVGLTTILITLAYSIGTAIPMFGVMYGGRSLLQKIPWLLPNTLKIQKAFGILMILTALAIFFNVDRRFQAYILEKFPMYGVGLTKLEDNETVKSQLEKLKVQGKDVDLFGFRDSRVAPELIAGGQWFNLPAGEAGSQPLTLASLTGKVVLLDFWTYTCINCIRTLPYVESWHEKYKDKGLVIIGVHSPEFEFEKSADNVKKAIKDFGLTYPIMQDNDFATWRAYNNRYWPAKYFIDKDGKIRSSHFGEGEYDESERLIQELLAETGTDVTNMPVTNPTYQTYARTPELYIGSNRFAPGSITFHGEWTDDGEYKTPSKGAVLEIEFNAKEVFLVARPKKPGSVSSINVQLQPMPVFDYLGEDIDQSSGYVWVDADRLYKLISLTEPGKYKLILEFADDNVELYAFTFG